MKNQKNFSELPPSSLMEVCEVAAQLEVLPNDVDNWCKNGTLYSLSVAYADANGYKRAIRAESVRYFCTFHSKQLQHAKRRFRNQVIASTQLCMAEDTEDTIIVPTFKGMAFVETKRV